MILRYAVAPLRGLALAGLAVVGLAAAVANVVAAMLVGPYPLAISANRRLARLARRLAAAWGGVPVADPYRPAPPGPTRRPDGWYAHGDQLFRSPRFPAYMRKVDWLSKDPATGRDFVWLIANLPVGGALALLGPALIAAGAVLVAVAPPPMRPLGVLAAVGGIAGGPALLRVHALWTRVLLQPAERSWWHTSGAGGWLRRRWAATWHCAALFGISVGAFGPFLVQVPAVVVFWGWGVPQLAPVTRWYANEYRRLAGRWSDMDIPLAYRPVPERPERGADGKYRQGRTLYATPQGAERAQRYRWVLRDPATWRDLAWMAAAPVLGVVLLPPVVLVLAGFFGLFWQPVVWPLWGLPIWLLAGWWVTPWYAWDALVAGVPPLGAVPAWASPLVGLALTLLGIVIAPTMLRLNARWGRLLLAPTRSARLAQRVERLTETRADAVDTQAADLRRIERDLHDGAQARLVALGLSLDTVERLMETDPAAARALLTQARDSSATALAELRDLVRGIHPPVLAERGLADAVRAVAMDTPLPVDVSVDLPGRPDAPVESAAYFAVTEALANAVRHAGATRVGVDIRYLAGALHIEVSDDGRGGADPARGSGLRGIGRRIGTFDGVLTVVSPPGGPTVLTMEIPCALSSPRTSTS